MSKTIHAWERGGGLRSVARLSFVTMCCMAVGIGVVHARGGTAKPPPVSATPAVTILPPAGPILPALSITTGSNGFSITGMVQSATVNGGCVAGSTAGGTVTINGIVITIPSDTIVQYPANTTTWADGICGISTVSPSIALDGTGGTPTPAAGPQPGPIYPSVELRVEGNIVNGAAGPAATNPPGAGATHIAALVYISQQSVNTGSGYISFVDYTDGSIYVATKDAAGNNGELRLLINDPNGRFGRAQTSTDARFSVDDANPTIKSGASGYPMCVPRTDPAVADDPLCPKINRPISDGTANTCRTFAAAGVAPAGGDIVPSPAGTPCLAFVMKAVAGMPGTGGFTGILATFLRGPNDPDPRQQVPFMIGDFISWQGTLVRGGNALAPASQRATTTGGPGAGDVIWVHTIDANVGVYTQPATLPSYIAVGEFGVGVDPNPSGCVACIVGIETTDRIFLEAATTDVASLVDIYFDDKGFALPAGNTTGPLAATPGQEYFRWLTTEGMTGTLTDQAAGKNPFVTVAQPFGGGIQTQYVGPQPGRARIRANKVPAINPALPCPTTAGSQGCGVTQSPTRYLRVVVRSLCAPAATGALGTNGAAVTATNIDEGTAATSPNIGRFFDINAPRASLPGAGPGTSGVAGSNGTCLQSAQFANGLFTGQYMAPVGEFIVPENTLAGFPIVPANFWQIGFMVYGEGGDGSTAPQVPQPW
jgi:hypothetical protein